MLGRNIVNLTKYTKPKPNSILNGGDLKIFLLKSEITKYVSSNISLSVGL